MRYRLFSFCTLNNLVLTYTIWNSSIHNCLSFPGTDIGSDYCLVLANLNLTLKKLEKNLALKRLDVDRLRNPETANKFIFELHGKFEPLLRLEEMSVGVMWEGIRESLKSPGQEVIGYRENKGK